jgi:hypothetical protein
MLKAITILLFTLTAHAVQGVDQVSLKTIEERFGEAALAAIGESTELEAFQLDGRNWNYVYPEYRDPNVQWSWRNDYRVLGKAVSLSSEQIELARELLMSEAAYWDVPPGETLMCLEGHARFALSTVGKKSTFVAIFRGECTRLLLKTEFGELVGGGLLHDEAKSKWEPLFDELFRGE